MHTAFSKGRRALTARGVTLLSLLASTMSFASVVYVGPETARQSLGIEHSIEATLPDPRAAFAADPLPMQPVMASGSRGASVANLVRIGGMAVGLRADEAIDASRAAPLTLSLGGQAEDALLDLHQAIEPVLRRCAQTTHVPNAQDVGYVLHPMSAFLASGPDMDAMVHHLLRRDGAGDTGPLACMFQDHAERHGLVMTGPLSPEVARHPAREG